MKTLDILQTISKIGKVLCKVVYICCVIGAAGCLLGILVLPFSDTGILKIGGVTIHGLIVNRVGIDPNSLYPVLAGILFACVGHAVVAKLGESYFRNELTAGTPFTIPGAAELLKLGIMAISVPLATRILGQIVSDIVAEFVGSGDAFAMEIGDSVSIGVTMILMSLVFRCGAEENGAGEKRAPQDL